MDLAFLLLGVPAELPEDAGKKLDEELRNSDTDWITLDEEEKIQDEQIERWLSR